VLAEQKDRGNMAPGAFAAVEAFEYIPQDQISMLGCVMDSMTRGSVIAIADNRS
jgi:hypothetical protein